MNLFASGSMECIESSQNNIVRTMPRRLEMHLTALEAMLSYFERNGCDHCFPNSTRSQVKQLVSSDRLLLVLCEIQAAASGNLPAVEVQMS